MCILNCVQGTHSPGTVFDLSLPDLPHFKLSTNISWPTFGGLSKLPLPFIRLDATMMRDELWNLRVDFHPMPCQVLPGSLWTSDKLFTPKLSLIASLIVGFDAIKSLTSCSSLFRHQKLELPNLSFSSLVSFIISSCENNDTEDYQVLWLLLFYCQRRGSC